MAHQSRCWRAGPLAIGPILLGVWLAFVPRIADAQLLACRPGEPEVRALGFKDRKSVV